MPQVHVAVDIMPKSSEFPNFPKSFIKSVVSVVQKIPKSFAKFVQSVRTGSLPPGGAVRGRLAGSAAQHRSPPWSGVSRSEFTRCGGNCCSPRWVVTAAALARDCECRVGRWLLPSECSGWVRPIGLEAPLRLHWSVTYSPMAKHS